MRHDSLGGSRRGVTLAELLVVIVILGLIASVAVHTLRPLPHEQQESSLTSSLIAARAQAIRTRRPVVVRLEDSSSTGVATALPDGSIISEARVRGNVDLNSLTGAAVVRVNSGGSRD